MYQTARMLAITLSRNALAVCMTRLAMRPAKSFWKNGQFCRTTCQWLCQRIMLVTPGISAFWRINMSARLERADEEHESHHAGEQGPLRVESRLAVDGLHQRNQLPYEHRDHRVDQRHGQAGHEHKRVPALGLAHEVPVKGDESRRRLARTRARRSADA